MAKIKSQFDKKWILKHGIPIIENYEGNLTLRALHYRLVAEGMTNDLAHYKKVVNTMIDARRDGTVAYDAFLDHERQTIGYTYYEKTNLDDKVNEAKDQIKAWANSYYKNRWENQPIYPEVFIEKKALQGVFERPCSEYDVALNPCKGYPSLTFLYDAKIRFQDAINKGKTPLILYFGDYDCSGEDIPRSIQDTLTEMGTQVFVKRIALMEHQVIEWKLPPAPTKETDTRGKNWDGLGQVELDAVEPNKIADLCRDAIREIFDLHLYNELLIQQTNERENFRTILKRDIGNILD